MDTEQLDLDLGPEPSLVAPVARLEAGHRALRRRRLAQGVAGTVAAFAVGGVGWVVVPGLAPHGDRPVAAGPTETVLTELPLEKPGECLGDLCVELVPHGMRELSPRIPGGDITLSFHGGRLVRLSPGVDVVKAIVDPTATGATESAAVEVVFRKTRFRVAMAQGFGYVTDQIDGTPKDSLEQWFAARHDLPEEGNCGVLTSSPAPALDRDETPGPGKCWVNVDEHGRLVPHEGVTFQRQLVPDLADGALPPGVQVAGVAFTRDGKDWYGVVRRIGDRAFVNATLARVSDLAPGTTLEKWAARTAPQMSMTGVPDPDYRTQQKPQPWQTLSWWDPKTGAFEVPPGITVVRHVDNPMKYAAPDDSAGLIFEFRGKRYWSMTEVHPAPVSTGSGEPDDVRAGGITATQTQGRRADGSFDAWLESVVADFTHVARAAK